MSSWKRHLFFNTHRGRGEVARNLGRRDVRTTRVERGLLRVTVQTTTGLRRLEIARVVRSLIQTWHQLALSSTRIYVGNTYSRVRLDGEGLLLLLLLRLTRDLLLDLVDDGGHGCS